MNIWKSNDEKRHSEGRWKLHWNVDIFELLCLKKKGWSFSLLKSLHNEVKILNQSLWDAVNTVPEGKTIAYMFIRKEKLLKWLILTEAVKRIKAEVSAIGNDSEENRWN